MTNSILSALLNGVIASLLLAAAIRLGLFLTPRSILSAASRYTVWWMALLATALLPLAYLPTRPVRHGDAADIRPIPPAPTAQTPLPVPASTPIMPSHAAPRASYRRFPMMLTVGRWTRWLLTVWAGLSGLMLLRLLASWLLLERRKAGASAAPAELTAQIAASLAQCRSSRRAAVLCSPNIGTPVLAGLWRPAILIPERLFAEMTDEELTQIGLHEAAHLARRDDFALLAARAIEAVLPFHPVVRWIVRQIDLERELACDDFVVERIAAARSYAECLLRVVELCSGARASYAATGMAGGRSQLTKRVDRLLDGERQPELRRDKARLLAAMGIVAALTGLAIRTPRAVALAIPPAATQGAQIASPPSPPQTPAAPQTTPTPARSPLAPVTSPPVILPVTVTDLAHRYVSGLTQTSFRVFEDGVEQQISDVSEVNPPLSVEIVVDVSGSMRNRRPLMQAAILALMRSANPADEFQLLTFNDQVNLIGPFGNDPELILSQPGIEQPRGGTSLRDAIVRAVQWQNAHYSDRALVVISDGIDNASSVSVDEVRHSATALNTPIWAITLASPETYPRHESLWLSELAEQSLGHEFVTDDPAEVAVIAASVTHQPGYVLKFRSNNPVPDGKFRRLKVEVVTAPPGSLRIRARTGYYAIGR